MKDVARKARVSMATILESLSKFINNKIEVKQ